MDIPGDKDDEAEQLSSLFDQYVPACVVYVQLGLVDGSSARNYAWSCPSRPSTWSSSCARFPDAFLGPGLPRGRSKTVYQM